MKQRTAGHGGTLTDYRKELLKEQAEQFFFGPGADAPPEFKPQ